jgi:hypothetical protein
MSASKQNHVEAGMDIQRILQELRGERDKLSKAIELLESGLSSSLKRNSFRAGRQPVKRRITPEGRKRLSELMKRRWAVHKKSARRTTA